MNHYNLYQKSLNFFPRGTQTSSKAIEHIGGIPPIFIESASGCYMKTTENKNLLDFGCGLGPIILGYNDQDVNQVIKNQLNKGILFSLPSLKEAELAEKLSTIVPNAEAFRFSKNGSDAVLASIRIASAYTGRKHIARFGYNGFTDRVAISFNEGGIPEHNKELIHEFKYNNVNSLESILKNYDCACVIMEPVSLEEPKNNFLKDVRRLATKHNALLIFDEVVTGFRFDFQGCQKIYGVDADLICLGKAMANGMPLSVICGKKEYMKMLKSEVFFSMTFGGEILSIISALKTIEKLEQKDYNHIWKLGGLLEEGILEGAHKNKVKIDFKGMAPRHSLAFNNENNPDLIKAVFNQQMFEQGIFMPTVVYINFSHTEKDIDYAIKSAKESFRFISENKQNLERLLKYEKSKPIF